MYNNELYHYNIKGSKWGQRRFQNKDGSLTPAGRERYGVGKGGKKGTSILDKLRGNRPVGSNKTNSKQTSKKSPEQIKKEQEAAIEAKKKAVLASRSAKELYDNANLFTTDELRAAKARLELERDIKSLEPKAISKGEARVRKIEQLTKAGKATANFMEVGMSLYNNVAKLHNSFTDSGRENPWPIIKEKGDKGMTKKAKAAREAQEQAAEKDRRAKEKAKKESAKENAKAAREEAYKAAYEKTKEAYDDYFESRKNASKAKKQKTSKWQNDNDDFDDVVDGEFRDVTASDAAKSPQAAIGQNYIMALLEDKQRR